jgi:hypothetical protein
VSRTVRRALVMVIAAVVLAVAGWYLLAPRDRGPDLTRGGPMLATDLGAVERLQLVSGGATFRFDRLEESLWTLSGAVADWVDPLRLAYQLGPLGEAVGGPLIAGTEPEDRRYEFNAPGSIRLSLYGPQGEERLLLGATNPVTGRYYASGAGRPACFSVEASVGERLAGLVQAVRLQTLLPPVKPAALARIEVVRARRTDVLTAAEGRWWLKVAALDDPALPPVARRWHAFYGDRHRQDAEGLWILADDRAVAGLVNEVSGLQAVNLPDARDVGLALDQWGLGRPLITVRLEGPGIDPDPTGPSRDRLEIGFAMPLDDKVVPAVRRGLPVLAPRQAIETLEQPPGVLAHAFALTRRPLLADRFVLRGPEGLLMAGRRENVELLGDERSQWRQVEPEEDVPPAQANVLLQTTLVDLDRLGVLAVLAPTTDAAVLRSEERLEIILERDGVAETWYCGRLEPNLVPGGLQALAAADGVTGPVGLWRPADGRLLQVPPTLLLTARTLRP